MSGSGASLARPFIDFVHPDDTERTLQQNRGVKTGGHALAFENRYLCKDDSYRWLLRNAASDSPQEVIYSLAHDVTELNRARAEREALCSRCRPRSPRSYPYRRSCRSAPTAEKVATTQATGRPSKPMSRSTRTPRSVTHCPDCYAKEVEPQFEGQEGQ
jgi:hypothetical protein